MPFEDCAAPSSRDREAVVAIWTASLPLIARSDEWSGPCNDESVVTSSLDGSY
jgi:hypothetical protein